MNRMARITDESRVTCESDMQCRTDRPLPRDGVSMSMTMMLRMLRLVGVVVLWCAYSTRLERVDGSSSTSPLDDRSYHTLDRLQSALESLSGSSFSMRHVTFPRRTHFNHTLSLVQFTDRGARPFTLQRGSTRKGDEREDAKGRMKKLKGLLTFGEHPRELMTIESCLHLVKRLRSASLVESDAESNRVPTVDLYPRFLGQFFELHLVCIFNPDGLSVQEQASLLKNDQRFCQRHNGRGVDLNRNSGWEWGGKGSSPLLGNEEYRGEAAWSEIESQFLLSLSRQTHYDLYLSVHSGEQQLFTPFVDSVSARLKRIRPQSESDTELISYVVRRSDNYLRNSGIGWQMNSYSADGTYYDYMAGVAQVQYTLCLEAWGDSSLPFDPRQCFTQFNPSSQHLAAELTKVERIYENIFEHIIWKEFGVTFETWKSGAEVNVVANEAVDFPHIPVESLSTTDVLKQLEATLIELNALEAQLFALSDYLSNG